MKDWALEKTYRFSQGLVRYDVTGEGPAIVLVHGTPWFSYTWHKLIPALAQRYTVYYYDYIGYGLSEKAEGQDVSLASQGRLLTELIKHWRLECPRVIAHDFGGATSLRSHLLDACDFKKLMLLNVVAISPWGSPFFSHIQKHESAFAGVPAYIHEAIVRAYIQGAIYNRLHPKLWICWSSPGWVTQTRLRFIGRLSRRVNYIQMNWSRGMPKCAARYGYCGV